MGADLNRGYPTQGRELKPSPSALAKPRISGRRLAPFRYGTGGVRSRARRRFDGPAREVELGIQVSLVIAVHDEAENVGPLCREIAAAMAGRFQYEALFVDDGSTDGTAACLLAERRDNPAIRVLRHDRRSGKSAALRSAVAAARGEWIVTLDGDGQNDPADIPRLLDVAWRAAEAGPVLVAGLRQGRQDTLSRRFASRFANRLRRALLKDGCPDTACGVKVFRRSDYLVLPFFDGMHRFFPALFRMYGHALVNAPVNDRPRRHGRTKYTNLGRALAGLPDLLGVLWLRKRTTRPGSVTEETAADRPAAETGRIAVR